jgi:ATP-dependent Clp protease ATP-binding subunit ClpC
VNLAEAAAGADASRPRYERPKGFFVRLFSTPLVLAGAPVTGSGAADPGPSNFTPRAQQALAFARKEADKLNHNFVSTEHLLLGLLTLGQGVAVNVVQKQGVSLDLTRAKVKALVSTGPDQKIIGNIPYTPRLRKVLALAAKEAKSLNHTYVGTEHLLLGLLREGDGVAARALIELGVELEKTRKEILKELDPNFGK